MPRKHRSEPVFVHVTAKVVRARLPLHHPEIAPIVWRSLRRAFPQALAASLMPDHVHGMVPAPDEATGRRDLAFALRGLQRRTDVVGDIRWARASTDGVVRPGLKAARHARYIVLNPHRKGLVDDPLCWPWTTHRDVMGAVVDPWVTPERLARACWRSEHDFGPWFHRYVCSESTVDPRAARLPEPVAPGGHAELPLAYLRDAALSCTRSEPDALTRRTRARRVFLQLAPDQGWRDAKALASFCNMSPRGVRWARERSESALLIPARLCLGDARLREGRVWPPQRDRRAASW
jgi:hypothetical protein